MSRLRLLLRQPRVHPDVVSCYAGRCFVWVRGVGAIIGDGLRRAEQSRAEQPRASCKSAADAQIFEGRRIVDRQRLDQTNALRTVGDFEDATRAVGIGFVDRIDVNRRQRRPRMRRLRPFVEAREDNLPVVTLLRLMELHLEVISRSATLYALAEFFLEIVRGQGLLGVRLLKPWRA
jgi:hypothetical protein